MTFDEILDQAIVMLRRRGRLTYRALKLQFNLDDEYLDVLKDELIEGQRLAVDENGRVLVWTGDPAVPGPDARHEPDAESRFHALLRAMMWLLQRERRVTYRELKYTFGLDETLLAEIREELLLRRVAIDEEDKVLVWTGETQPMPDTAVVTPPAAPTLTPLVTEADNQSEGLTAPPKAISTDAPSGEPADTLEPTRSAPEAERRQLTVMFCDLADSTKLSQQLDPEDLREVIRAYQQTSAEVIHRFDGYIAQHLGDGLLIYFGWPVAHEDDAQRAAYAGLGIVEAITTHLNPRLEQEKSVQLAVRLGIHTGPVVVGEMGGGERPENLAMGDTPNIASRIQGLAIPNTVVLSAATARLVQGTFALEDQEWHTLKGVAEPIQVFGVLGPLEIHEDEAAGGSMPTLVGRDEEIGLLLRRWEQSKGGLGQVVLISGEAGIGKTALVEVIRAQVRDEGLMRIAFRCSPYHQSSALYPVLTHVEYLLHFDRDDPPNVKLKKLEQGLQPYSLPLEEVVPLFAALLSVPLLEGRYPVPSLTPQQQKYHTLDALVAWLVEEAERQPVLVVWENLHWADPSTLEMLGLVLEQTPTVPLLNVLTFRPEFQPPWPTRSHMTPITLNRLERSQVEALIMQLADGKALPDEVVAHIVAKTDGVPLYVEELTKMLLESELLRDEADHYVLTGPLMSVAIPDTLQDSLMARLDQLNNAKEVAQLGAVLGREFAYEMFQALSSQDEDAIQAGLAQLVDAELLYQRGRPPRATYIFKHALVQDAAYQSLLKSSRQRYHEQIARLLEAQFPDRVETQPELVAYHYLEAGYGEQAVAYNLRAGDRSADLYANAEAITYYEQALTILDTLPETDAARHRRIDLHLRMASLHVLLGHYSDSLPFFDQALELAEAAEDSKAIAHVETRIGRVHYSFGNYERARVSFERALELSQRIQDITRMAICYQSLGYVYFSCDRIPKVIECFTQALQISEAAENQQGIVAACTYLSNAHTRAGNLADAVQWGRRALELGEQMQDDRRIAWACIMLAQAYVLTGDGAQAQTLLARALPLCDTVGDFLARAWVYIWSGDLLATGEKDFERALDHVQHVIRMGTESGGFLHEVSHQYARGAEYLLRLGRYGDAYASCHQGLAIAQNASNRLEYGYAYMVLAELHASEAYQDWKQAAWYLGESLKAFREVGAHIDVGRAHLAGARIALLRKDGTARQWAETARDIFAERGAKALLRDAKAVLVALR